MNAPDIESIDLSAYTGQPGSQIRVKVTDDFKVTSVKVIIHNPDGRLVEEGEAINATGTDDWIFVATVVNDSLEGDKITVMAWDRAENEGNYTHVL